MPQTRIQEKFYPLTSRIINLLRQGNLTAAEWRIWSYLVEVDPWGDRYEDFDYLSVMSICNCSKATLYRTIAKFQELKIFDFQARGLCLKNLIGTSQLRKPETEPDPPKNDSQPKTKPKTKTNERPKTKEPPILRKERPEPPQPPVTNNHPEVSDPWADLPEPPTSDRPEISDLEEIRSAARPEISDRQEPVSEMRTDSQICESSLKNENPVSSMRNESQICENEGLKPLSDLASLWSQTNKIELDPPIQPDGGVEQSKLQDKEVNKSEEVEFNDDELTQNEQIESQESKAQNESIKANETTTAATEEKDVPRSVTQNKTEIIRKPKKTSRKNLDKSDASAKRLPSGLPRRRQRSEPAEFSLAKLYPKGLRKGTPTEHLVAHQDSELPNDLINWMEELGIPLDNKVLNAIASHDISQAYGACRHVEETWETINNPRGVFLFQLPKQKIEKLGPQLPEIGKQMREQNEAIEEEMATDEYKQKAQEMFAKLRAKLGKKGQKN